MPGCSCTRRHAALTLGEYELRFNGSFLTERAYPTRIPVRNAGSAAGRTSGLVDFPFAAAARLGRSLRSIVWPKRPLDYSGSAGLLWAINGGRLIELHRTWAVIDVPLHRSQGMYYRRNVDAAKITLLWARQGPRKAGGPQRP